MKIRNTVFFLLLLFSLGGFAQTGKFSATLAYPLPIGDNFVADNYTGVIDLGVQYRFVETGPLAIGASLNGSYLTFENNDLNPPAKVTALFVAPRLFAELNVPALDKFRPTLGLGYAFTNFTTQDSAVTAVGRADEHTGGLNINLGISYDFTNQFFALAQYDFIKISRDDGIIDNGFNTQINLIKVGIGIRF